MHSDIPLGSIGWRMGADEEYWIALDEWFSSQTPEQKLAFAQRHPEPVGWSGFYERKGVDLK